MLTKRQTIYTIFGIFVVMGYVYTTDWPLALQTPLREQPYYFSSYQYNMIYFVTNLPICILGIPIGIMLDKIKLSYGIVIILTVCLVCQLGITLLFYFSFHGFYILLLILRGFFGLTGQAAYTVQAIVIEKVGGSHYDTMMGVCLTVPLFLSAMQPLITTSVYDSTHLIYLPMYICSGFIFCSFLSGFGLISYMKKEKINIDEQQQVNQTDNEEEFNCSNIKKYNYAFWLIILVTFLSETSLGGFLDNQVDLIVKRFNISYANAGRIMMIPFGFTPFGALFWGQFVYKHPHWRRNIIIIITLLNGLSHLMIFLLKNTNNPGVTEYTILISALFIFSISFAGFQTIIIPSITQLVSSDTIGTAFGISGSASSLSQTIMPIFNSIIISGSGTLAQNYRNLSLLYISIAITCLILSIGIRISHSKELTLLDKSQKDSLLNENQQSQSSNENVIN